jgi:hypothetical protein
MQAEWNRPIGLRVDFDMQNFAVIVSLCAVEDTVIRTTRIGTSWRQIGGQATCVLAHVNEAASPFTVV